MDAGSFFGGGLCGCAVADAARALTTISGEPLDSDAPLSQVLEIVLAAYSVIVFATLAGSIGAFFIGERKSGDTGDRG